MTKTRLSDRNEGVPTVVGVDAGPAGPPRARVASETVAIAARVIVPREK